MCIRTLVCALDTSCAFRINWNGYALTVFLIHMRLALRGVCLDEDLHLFSYLVDQCSTVVSNASKVKF